MGRILAWLFGILGVFALAKLRPERFEVVDDSMQPTFSHGDFVMTVTARPRLGTVVITDRLDEGRWSIKRLVAGPGDATTAGRLPDGEWWLVGDNRSRSVDSRQRGPVRLGPRERRVVLRYWPRPGLMG